MFTYDSFETLGVFTLLRPMFITLLVVSIVTMVMLLIPKTRDKWLKGYLVPVLSLIIIVFCTQLLYYSAIIVDELGLGGDAGATGMYGVIVALGIVNSIIYFVKKTSIQG